MSWKEKYKIVGIRPGPVIVHGLGRIDFSREDLPEAIIEQAISKGCPYIKRVDPVKKAQQPSGEEMTVAQIVAAMKSTSDTDVLKQLYGKRNNSPLVKKTFYKRMQDLSHDDSAH